MIPCFTRGLSHALPLTLTFYFAVLITASSHYCMYTDKPFILIFPYFMCKNDSLLD